MKATTQKKLDKVKSLRLPANVREAVNKIEKNLGSDSADVRKKAEASLDKVVMKLREVAKKKVEAQKSATPTAAKKVLSDLEKLIASDPELADFNSPRKASGGGRSDAKIDAERKAVAPGRRTSKKGWKNQYGTSKGGRVYYENRENRSDRRAPGFVKGKPYLQDGGYVHPMEGEEGYIVLTHTKSGATKIRGKYKSLDQAMMAATMLRDVAKNDVMIKDHNDNIVYSNHKMSEGGSVGDTRMKNRLREEKGYDMAYLNKLSLKHLKMLYDTEFNDEGEYWSEYAKGGKMEMGGKYYVIDAKDGKTLSKGFDSENEAKVEMYKMFENSNNPFLTIKKMAKGGKIVTFKYHKLRDENIWAIEECFQSGQCANLKFVRSEKEAITEVERLNKLGYHDYYAKGGVVGLYRIVPFKTFKVKDEDYVMAQGEKSFRVEGDYSEAEKAAQEFVKTNSPEIKFAEISKIDPSNPLKSKKISNVNIDNVYKYDKGGYMADGGSIADESKIMRAAKSYADNPNWTNDKLLKEYRASKFDLREFEMGYLKPSKVIGTGYKSSAIAKKLAKNYLEERIEIFKTALEMRGVMAKGGELEKRREYYQGTMSDDAIKSILKYEFPNVPFDVEYDSISGTRVYGRKAELLKAQSELKDIYKIKTILKGTNEVGLPYLSVPSQFVFFADGGYMAKGGYTQSGEELYRRAENMSDELFEEAYSTLSKKEKEFFESLVRLGDSEKLALVTTLNERHKPSPDKTTWDLYRYAKGGKVGRNYAEWEMEVTQILADKIGSDYGDASAIVEANSFYMQQSWTKGLSALETAQVIDEKSIMAKGGTTMNWKLPTMGKPTKKIKYEIVEQLVGYTPKGENYEYVNYFTRVNSDEPVPQKDFEKFVDAWHEKLSGNKADEAKYDALKKELVKELGRKTVEDMEDYVERTHNADKMQYRYAKGGSIGFEALSKKVAKRYKGKKVPAKYQKDYGKTYDKEEAQEVGNKVAAKVYRQQQGKMAKGGSIDSRLKRYATLDVNDLQSRGAIAITDTKIGVIIGDYENGTFTFRNVEGQKVFSGNKKEAIDFVKNNYQVEEMAKGGKITVGEKFGDWSVTQFTPVKYDDYGAPFGGVIKIVNQDNFETIVIRNDLSLRGAKWFVSLNKRTISDADPKIVIEKAISVSKTKMAKGGKVGGNGRLFKHAKATRKEGESWQNAIKRAAKELS